MKKIDYIQLFFWILVTGSLLYYYTKSSTDSHNQTIRQQFISFSEASINRELKERVWHKVSREISERNRFYSKELEKLNMNLESPLESSNFLDNLHQTVRKRYARYEFDLEDLLSRSFAIDLGFMSYQDKNLEDVKISDLLVIKYASDLFTHLESSSSHLDWRRFVWVSGLKGHYTLNDTLKAEVFLSNGMHCNCKRVLSYEVNNERFTDVDTLQNLHYKIPVDYKKDKVPVTITSIIGCDTIVEKENIKIR